MEKLHFEDLSPLEKRNQERKFKPSEEFLEAKKPFEYNYTFSGGEILVARQSNTGQGIIEFRKDDEKIFDARDLLPAGWKFVTPTYLKKHPKEESLFYYLDNTWAASPERNVASASSSLDTKTLPLVFGAFGCKLVGTTSPPTSDWKIGAIAVAFCQ